MIVFTIQHVVFHKMPLSLKKQWIVLKICSPVLLSGASWILVEQQAPILSIQEIVSGIQSSNSDSQFTATQSCRRILSRERKPPIDDVVEAGVLPRLVEFLSRCDRYVDEFILICC